jgi:hypothetical protein
MVKNAIKAANVTIPAIRPIILRLEGRRRSGSRTCSAHGTISDIVCLS